MTTARRPRPVPQGDIEVGAELVLLREILERLESTVGEINTTVTAQGKQIDRWRTVGAIVGPSLFALGAWVMSWADQAFLWLAKAVKP